jgi:hypothetical protein
MCALGRCVPELRLNRLDGVTSGRGLAGHRMPTDLMVADLPETERSLHGPQGPRVRVDTRGEASVLAEQELRTRISLLDVPANRVDHVLGEGEGQHLVVLARRKHGRPLFVAPLHRPIDDELRRDVPDSISRDCVDFARAKTEAGRQVEECVPLRVHLEHALEEPVAFLLGVPFGGSFWGALHRNVGHRCEVSPFPHEPENSSHDLDAVVDRLRSEVSWQPALELVDHAGQRQSQVLLLSRLRVAKLALLVELFQWGLGLVWLSIALFAGIRAARGAGRGGYICAVLGLALACAAALRWHVEVLLAARHWLREQSMYESRMLIKVAIGAVLAIGIAIGARAGASYLRRQPQGLRLAIVTMMAFAVFLFALTAFLDDMLPLIVRRPPGRQLVELAFAGTAASGIAKWK